MSKIQKAPRPNAKKRQGNAKKQQGNRNSEQPQASQKVQSTHTVNLARIVNNTVISLLGQVVTWTATLLLTIAYGRFLGDVKLGELYFALSFVLLIGFPIELGFNQQLTRDVAQEPAKLLRYLSNVLLIKVVFWLVLYGLLLLLCGLLGYSEEIYNLVMICGLTLLSSSIANIFGAAHYAFERAVFPVVGTILEKGLSALFGFLLLSHGASVQVMGYVLLGGSLINAVWQASWLFRLNKVSFTIDVPLIRTLLSTSVPFIIYGVLGVIYYRLDTVLLSLMASTAVIGWYGAGYRIFDTFVFLPSIVINAIMYPVFSKLSLNSTSTLKMAAEKSLNFLLFAVFPMATIMIFDAPAIIALLYHRPEFSHTVPALQALAPGIVFLYINSVFSSILISTKLEKKITIMAAIALVFNLSLNLILIPYYQHIAAAIVTSLTELLLLGLSLIFIPRYLLPKGSIRVAAKALIASIIMALVIWVLRTYTIFITLPVTMLVYLAVATLLRTIPREDLQALRKAIRNKARKTPTVSSASEKSLEESKNERKPGMTFRIKQLYVAAIKYITNHLISRIPSFKLRHAWYRRVLHWRIEPSAAVFMGQHVQMAGLRSSGKKVSIGAGTVINRNCLLYTTGGLVIGKNVSISAGVWLVTGSHDINTPRFSPRYEPIIIGDYVWIGMRATILAGVTIGEGAVVMAGAVVARDVLPYTVVGGVPAKVVSQRTLQDPSYSLDFHPLFE